MNRPGRTIAPDHVIHQNKRDMKTHTKPKLTWTRIVEMFLLTFILAFVARATPNLNLIPDIPWANRTNDDLGATDDKAWGNFARMKFMETHPPEGTPTLKPVRPEKFWLQRPRGMAV
jgi:hypothetical protein